MMVDYEVAVGVGLFFSLYIIVGLDKRGCCQERDKERGTLNRHFHVLSMDQVHDHGTWTRYKGYCLSRYVDSKEQLICRNSFSLFGHMLRIYVGCIRKKLLTTTEGRWG